jgi:Reverse transcriptase (RNA-dependent DNA polymerase)
MNTRSRRRLNLCDAEVRPPGILGSDCLPAETQNQTTGKVSYTAGIHVSSLPTRQSDISSSEPKGLGGGNSARQRKTGLWSDVEIQELRSLATSNTGPRGVISWVKVEELWKSRNLPERSKAALSTKWRDLISRSKHADPTDVTAVSQHDVESILTGASDSHNIIVRCVDEDIVNPTSASPMEPKRHPVPVTTDTSSLFRKNLYKSRKIGCQPHKRKPPMKVTGIHIKPIVCEVDDLIKAELKNSGVLSWDKLSILVYAGAMTVSEIGNRHLTEKISRAKEWFKSSYRECESLRRTIGKATAELLRRKNAEVAPTIKQAMNIRLLKKKYKVESSIDITSLVERLKCRLQLLQSRIELRKDDERRLRVRRTPTKTLLRNRKTEEEGEAPDVNKIRRFWKNIVGVKKSFNPKNEQLVAWERSMSKNLAEEDLRDHLTPELWQKVVHKSKPWKAPGPDGLQGYWWKVFNSANKALYQLVQKLLTTGKALPQGWIAEGRIILLFKSGSRSDPANFRPIACLNTCYKLLTGYIAAYLNRYATERKILPNEQVALREGVWGGTHALTLDQMMVADAKNQKQKPISVAWIDYAKAFDSVPHSYIGWLFSKMRVPTSLRTFLSHLMDKWRVKYEVRGPRGQVERSSYLRIRSGVLQGDSFSPLLFCLAMAPISHAINQVGGHYVTASGKPQKQQTSLSHLFYMDDLKLFASSAENLAKQIDIVSSISDAISMKLNVKKCAVAHFIPKRLQKDRGNEDDGEESEVGSISFPLIGDNSSYKYLGLEQSIGLKESEAWDRVEDKCCDVVRRVWESDLTFRQKVNSHNSTVIPAFTYVASCIIKGSGKFQSILERGDSVDKKFRSILVELKARYKSSSVARLYLTKEKGGYGLRSVRDSLEEATIYSWAYLCTKAELRGALNLFVSMADRGKRCVVSDARSVLRAYNIEAQIDVVSSSVIMNGTKFVDAKTLARHVVSTMRIANNTKRYETWHELGLAGRVLRPTSSIDLNMSFSWLREGKLSSVAVRNILAAQEGCLLTKAHPASVSRDKNCRACRHTTETTEHILSSCSKWLPNLYVDRHDSVARNIHYKLCQKYGLTPPHYSQKVESVLGNESCKLYWNQPVQTKTIIRHNKPDIIAFETVGKTAVIVEVAVSWFTGIEKQTEIKRNRYCVNGNWDDELSVPYPRGDNLLRELQTLGWKTKFLPIVIGATGEVLSNLGGQMQDILGFSRDAVEDCIERMQRSAVLGSSRIIKNHLAEKVE